MLSSESVNTQLEYKEDHSRSIVEMAFQDSPKKENPTSSNPEDSCILSGNFSTVLPRETGQDGEGTWDARKAAT